MTSTDQTCQKCGKHSPNVKLYTCPLSLLYADSVIKIPLCPKCTTLRQQKSIKELADHPFSVYNVS